MKGRKESINKKEMTEIVEETRTTKTKVRNLVRLLKKKVKMSLIVMMKKFSMLLQKKILMKMKKLH